MNLSDRTIQGDSKEKPNPKVQITEHGYLMKNNNPLPNIRCHICGTEDCEEILYGNQKQHITSSLILCKQCQKELAAFLEKE